MKIVKDRWRKRKRSNLQNVPFHNKTTTKLNAVRFTWYWTIEIIIVTNIIIKIIILITTTIITAIILEILLLIIMISHHPHPIFRGQPAGASFCQPKICCQAGQTLLKTCSPEMVKIVMMMMMTMLKIVVMMMMTYLESDGDDDDDHEESYMSRIKSNKMKRNWKEKKTI